jgi:hypothetical protein
MNRVFLPRCADGLRWVYHYTSLRTAMEHILCEGQLKFSPMADVKDPRESKSWSFSVTTEGDESMEDGEFHRLQDEATARLKGTCKLLCMSQDEGEAPNAPDPWFRRGFARARMWAQYGDGHRGVCLVFEREKLHRQIKMTLAPAQIYSGQVTYANRAWDDVQAFNLAYSEIRRDTLESLVEAKIAAHYRTYFLTKVEDWASEVEWRWVLRGTVLGPEYAPIADALAGIVLGVDVPGVYEPAIWPLAEKYGAPIARISWSNGAPHLAEIGAAR